MPSERDATWRSLGDIQHHIALAERFAAGLSWEEFGENELRLYAVTRCLEIISEASRRLPNELKARHPSIPWQEMAAAGNVYRHEYEHVAPRRVWRTLTVSLPALRDAVAHELAGLAADQP